MNEQQEFITVLTKKAKGFSADEIVEEYSAGEDGNLVLAKRKISTKYFPPDTAAIKSVMELDGISKMSDEELLAEKVRLLAELKNLSAENEEKNEEETR